MKIIVFGGSGFLGSHVADKLTDAGHHVVIFDIEKSPYLNRNQTMILGDILNKEFVRKSVQGADVVFNFAGIADIDEAALRPLDTIQLNIMSNGIILEACRLENVKRYVFASTVYVYSKSGSFYRASKQACENYIEIYNEEYGLDYTILRYGTLYGPRSDQRNAIFNYINQGLEKGVINYDGNRDAYREYIHVEDAARASSEILKPEFANQHIVLTGNQMIKVEDMLGMLKEIIPSNVKINYMESNKKAHYVLTPHNYSPKIGKKYIPPLQIDLGQGLLHQVEKMYKDIHYELSDC